ncbi:MAG: hypothetical protein ACI91B_004207 [Planctomycetota bacterium]|jgi:hypothetical protein
MLGANRRFAIEHHQSERFADAIGGLGGAGKERIGEDDDATPAADESLQVGGLDIGDVGQGIFADQHDVVKLAGSFAMAFFLFAAAFQ